MSNLLKLTPENYYTKEANMQYVSVSQYKEFNGTTGKMGCEAYAMAKLRGEVEPLRCEVCDYCADTEILDGPVSMDMLMGEI